MDNQKVLFTDDNSAQTCASAMHMGDFVRHMQSMGYTIDITKLEAMMKSDGFIERTGERAGQPTKQAYKMGLMCLEESVNLSDSEHLSVMYAPLITQYGQKYLFNLYSSKVPKKKVVVPFQRRYITRNRIKAGGSS